MAKKTDTEVNTDAPVAPRDRHAETFDPVYVMEALNNAVRQLEIVAATRAEYDHALHGALDALTWLNRARTAEVTIHKDASIPPGT